MKNIFLLSAFLLTFPLFTKAADFNLYVDKNYSGEELGSMEKPFSSIAKAIEGAKQNRPGLRKIYVANGEYNENISLSESIKITGQNKEQTIINVPELSTVTLDGGNKIENITISGGFVGLTIKGLSIIENAKIVGAKRKGIDILPETSFVIISDSEISKNGGKGIYVQKGNSIYISGNLIKENEGEGLDIRQNISGLVMENEMSQNTESGIETLIGGSDLVIKKNIVTDNLANGIASQSYPEVLENGKLKIIENTISNNGKYGFYCGSPSGGGTHAKTYFSESILLEKNSNASNAKKPISGSCHFERQTKDYISNISSDIEQKIIRETNSVKDFQNLETHIDNLITENQSSSKDIQLLSFFRKIFIGISKEKIDTLQKNNAQLEKNLLAANDLLGKTENQYLRNSLSVLTNNGQKEISTNIVVISKSNRWNKIFWLPQRIVGFFR